MRIIHLSDIHYSYESWHKQVFDAIAIPSLIEDLKLRHAETPIDLIVISGDLINKGGKSFFDPADQGKPSPQIAFQKFNEDFIQKIVKELKISPLQFILVPGNHDVDQNADTKIIEKGVNAELRDDATVSDYMSNDSDEGIKRILPYNEFKNDFYKNDTTATLTKFHSFFLRKIHEKTVGIAAINSSWRAYDSEKDSGNMIIGDSNIRNGYRKSILQTDFKIAVLHHPIEDLAKFERDYIKSFLCKSFDLILFGHLHKGEDEGHLTGDGHETIFNSAPCNWPGSYATKTDDYKNGYSIIDVSSDEIKITHRIYSHKCGQYTIDGARGKNGISSYKIHPKDTLTDIASMRGCTFTKDIHDAWHSIENSTNPPINLEVVLADRKHKADELVQSIIALNKVITIQANTAKESLAFILAVVKSREELKGHQTNAIVATQLNDFKILARETKPLLLITTVIDPDDIAICISNGHTVLYADGGNNKTPNALIIKLSRQSFSAFAKGFESKGLSAIEAQKITKECGVSFPVFCRINSRIASAPDWATEKKARIFIPIMFAQQWIDSKDGDKEILSLLSKKSYEELESDLERWAKVSDSPVFKLADVWNLTSQIDCWYAIARHLQHKDFELLKQAVLKVLTAKDPSIDLPPAERWLANVKKIVPPYSSALRRGLAQSLVNISVLSRKLGISDAESMQRWVDSIVKEILNTEDPSILYSTADVMRLLAEASPSAFLQGIEQKIRSFPGSISVLFSESDNSFTSSARYTDLLWALECIAWSPDYLAQVSLILCDLSEMDPGGRLSNRPFPSLLSFYRFWHPQTFANLDQRMCAIKTIHKRRPNIALRFILSLIPQPYADASNNPHFELRNENDDFEIKVPRSDVYKGLSFITNELMSLTPRNAEFWGKVIDVYPNFPLDDRNVISETLTNNIAEVAGSYEFIRKLRELISKHKKYATAKWALPGIDVDKLTQLFKIISSKTGIEKHLWLFDSYNPKYIDEYNIPTDAYFEHNDAIAKNLRTAALNEIIEKLGFPGIESLVANAVMPQLVGNTLSEISIESSWTNKIIDKLNSRQKSDAEFSAAYISAMAYSKKGWWQNVLQTRMDNINPEFWKKILGLFPFSQELIDVLSKMSDDIQTIYWRDCSPIIRTTDIKLIKYAIEKYAVFGRLSTCLNIFSYSEITPDNSLIIQVLEIPLNRSIVENDIKNVDSYTIQKLFETLYSSEEVDKDRLKKLEWYYFPFLTNGGFQGTVKYLHNDIVTDPQFFVDLLKHLYFADNDKNRIPAETEEKMALVNQCYHVLETCKIIPGGGTNPSVDLTSTWVKKAIELCSESKRARVGKNAIGKLLANGYSMVNGSINVVQGVLEVLDSIVDEDIYCGFEIGVYNSRGVIEGSMAARDAADAGAFLHYFDSIKTTYPHVASLIKKMADYYRSSSASNHEREELENFFL